MWKLKGGREGGREDIGFPSNYICVIFSQAAPGTPRSSLQTQALCACSEQCDACQLPEISLATCPPVTLLKLSQQMKAGEIPRRAPKSCWEVAESTTAGTWIQQPALQLKHGNSFWGVTGCRAQGTRQVGTWEVMAGAGPPVSSSSKLSHVLTCWQICPSIVEDRNAWKTALISWKNSAF